MLNWLKKWLFSKRNELCAKRTPSFEWEAEPGFARIYRSDGAVYYGRIDEQRDPNAKSYPPPSGTGDPYCVEQFRSSWNERTAKRECIQDNAASSVVAGEVYYSVQYPN